MILDFKEQDGRHTTRIPKRYYSRIEKDGRLRRPSILVQHLFSKKVLDRDGLFVFACRFVAGERGGKRRTEEGGNGKGRRTAEKNEDDGPIRRRKVCAIPICPPAAGRIWGARAPLLWLVLAFY